MPRIGRSKPSGRGRLVVAVLAASLLAALIAVPALAEQGTAGIPLPPPPPPGAGQSETSGGSGAGYPDASPAQAEDLFTDSFPATIHSLASDPPDVSGQHTAFLGDHTALLAPAGDQPTADDLVAVLERDRNDLAAARRDLNDLLNQGSTQGTDVPQLVSSTLPLRAGEAAAAPIDLSLRHEGDGYVPGNPLVDVKLPDDLADGVAIGDQGIRLDVGGSGTATADPVAQDNLFYADAAPATDVVLAPISTGLETFYQLRAPESPERFEIRFSLPDGAALQGSGDGGAAIVTDTDTLAAIYPPIATDAAGNPVPVSMSIREDTLVLDVPHSDPGIRYPISVDPVTDLYTWSTNGQGAFADWVANKTTGSPYLLRTTCVSGINCQGGLAPTGLYVEVPANSAVAKYSLGAWQYSVPHYPWTTAYIAGMNIGPLNFVQRADTNANPFAFAGIYVPGSDSYLAAQSQSTAASNLYWSLDPGTATSGKQAVFELWSWVDRTVTAWRDAYLGGAAIYLSDTDDPELTDVTHTGIQIGTADWSLSNWVDNVTASVSVAVADNGLGVKNVYVPTADGSIRTVSESCTGTSASPCPLRPAAETGTYDTSRMPSGANITGVAAGDALDKGAVRNFVVRVDHDPPVLSSITGGLAPTPSGSAYRLLTTATDGDASDTSGHNWQSGVKRIQEFVNGTQVGDTGTVACTADEGSCPLTLDKTISSTAYQPDSSGSLHMKVVATDQLGHTKTQQWDVPIPDTSIDSGPSGPTNSATPTFTYHSSIANSTFKCRIDGAAFASCPAAGYTVSTALAEGSHTFEVKATDSAGHVDATPAPQTFVVDRTPPVLAADGALFASSNPVVGAEPEVDFDATDSGSGVTEVSMSVDGQQVDDVTQDCSAGACEYNDILEPDLSGQGPGQHSYDIVATDAAGNSSLPLSGMFRLDPTPPVLAVSGPLIDSSGGPLDAASADAVIDATDNPTGDSGIAKIEVTVDDNVESSTDQSCAPTCPASTSTSYTYVGGERGLGPHTVRVTVTDGAGNSQWDEFDVEEPAPPAPAECPQVTPSVQSSGTVLTAAQAEAGITQDSSITGVLDPSNAGYDDASEEQLDPSVLTPVDPPAPTASTGTLTEDELGSQSGGSINVDDVVCLTPMQVTPDETPARVANDDSLLYANAATDTDTIVRPSAAGETVVEVAHGSGAPDNFEWQVGMPSGYQLELLPDGGVAILDPDVPAPDDITVPPPPLGTQDPDQTGEVTTQLAEADYVIPAAEAATDNSVIAVIPRPYFVDDTGAVHAGALSVTGPTTLTASGSADTRALVTKVLSSRRAPRPTPSFFMLRRADEVAEQAHNFACTFAGRSPDDRRLLYLDWGSAKKFDNQYGTSHFDHAYPNSVIRPALRRAADGYAQCWDPNGHVRIVYGNNNNMDANPGTKDNANAAGRAQAHAAKVLADYQRNKARNSRLPYGKEDAGVGGDIEPGFDLSGAAAAKHLVNGAAMGGGGPYYNDGTANLDNVNGETNHWTVDDLCEVTFTPSGHRQSLPEIYHSANIDQWEHVRRNCHSQEWFYGGVVWADIWSDYSSARREWNALRKHTPAPLHKFLVNFANADDAVNK